MRAEAPMIKTYIRVQMSSEGESPKQIIERLRKIGAVPVVGDYDFEMTIGEDDRIFDKLEEIHHVLRGSDVRYVVTTRTDVEAEQSAKSRQIVAHYVDQKPLELKLVLYRAKLDRWRAMGLDVTDLEKLLETDLEQFKSASREFLRTHLDHMSVVKDKGPDENNMDGQVLGLLNESGKSLADIMSVASISEEQATLSLGRLISAGSANRVTKDGTELYSIVSQPSPGQPAAVRKALVVLPAKDDAEAEERVLDCIRPEGTFSKDLARASRLPKVQFTKALASLMESGKVTVTRKGRQEVYNRT